VSGIGGGAFQPWPVMVLGADGFLGRWIARTLTRAGVVPHLGVLDPAAAQPVFQRYGVGGQVHGVDVRAPGALEELLGRLRPALVVNAIGYGVAPSEKRAEDAALAHQLNADLPVRLVRALAAVPVSGWQGRRVVHIGSVYEYGQIGGHLPEEAEPHPIGLYGQTKLAGTLALQAACASLNVPGLTARICQVYGPGEHPGRLLPLLLAARTSGVLPPLSRGTQRKDFTYVEDVAEGLLRLALSAGPPGEVVNLATGRLATVAEFVRMAAQVLHLPPHIVKLQNPVSDNELVHEAVAIERLRARTGWTPGTDLPLGLQRTLAFEADADRGNA